MPNPNNTAEKIIAFSQIPEGWHFGEGTHPQRACVLKALGINRALEGAGFSRTDAFLGPDGDIKVTGYLGDYYLEVLVNLDGSFDHYAEKDDEVLFEKDGLSLFSTLLIISGRGSQWHTSDSFIRTITIPNGVGSNPRPLKYQAGEGYQLLIQNVSPQPDEHFASISNSITPASQEYPPFFSKTRTLTYLMAASS